MSLLNEKTLPGVKNVNLWEENNLNLLKETYEEFSSNRIMEEPMAKPGKIWSNTKFVNGTKLFVCT